MSRTAGGVRLSVVIPAFNEGGYLDAALCSLEQQDFTGGYEVIVVDNNSTDDTASVATRHGVTVLHEPRPGVCAARQHGTLQARGEIVVSTDADTTHPPDWLTRLDAAFVAFDGAIAVGGPCRYQDPPWWATVFPSLWFMAVSAVHRAFGRVFYITATNVAFVRDAFPGYDTSLTQGGDEVDFLRRLRGRGRVVWAADNPVVTSSRRMDQGLFYTLFVSFGYYYAGSYLLNRISSRTVLGVMPAIRREQQQQVRRRRLLGRVALLGTGAGLFALRSIRRSRSRRSQAGAERPVGQRSSAW